MRKRSLRGVNEHFDPIFNAVLPSAGTFQTSPRRKARQGKWTVHGTSLVVGEGGVTFPLIQVRPRFMCHRHKPGTAIASGGPLASMKRRRQA
ncbi:hypothetical protein DYI26_04205 [Halomonas litopenaei]|nr:hypothetical protein [Halomonas litopenaei]